MFKIIMQVYCKTPYVRTKQLDTCEQGRRQKIFQVGGQRKKDRKIAKKG